MTKWVVACTTSEKCLTNLSLGYGARVTGHTLYMRRKFLPYSIALHLWKKLLQGVCAVIFIDNEAAKFSWVSGTADSRVVSIESTILRRGLGMECGINLSPYFCRVPSHSNLGDDPSRGRFDELEKQGASRCHVDRATLFELSGG